jgi:hypothetical protein
MPKILMSDSVYQRLVKRATSFEDSAEDVIARLLDQADGLDPSDTPDRGPNREASRAAPGSVLPVHEYWIPILGLLVEAGGSAPSNDVVEALEERMKSTLSPRDFEPLKSGEIRWRNRARFARLRMKERGLLSDTSHRGVWEITDAGRDYLVREGGEHRR